MNASYGSQQPRDLVTLLERSLQRHASRPLFGTRTPAGSFRWLSYGAFGARVADLRAGLAQLGVGPGEAVALLCDNRVEWAIVAFATYGRRAMLVPTYANERQDVWRHVLADSGARVVVCANAAVAEAVEGMRGDLPALQYLVIMDDSGPSSLAALERRGREAPILPLTPEPDEIAAIIYTSGTTGQPKGVELSHGNLTHTVLAGQDAFPELAASSVALSILPWAHIYAQTGELYNFMSLGAAIAISGGPTTLAADLQAVRPTHLIAVPRVFQRIHAGIWQAMRDAGGLKLRLFEAALASARRRAVLGRTGMRYRVLDRLVLARIRERFGGRFQCALTASATMNPEVSRFFRDVGLPVYDCYGMTETSPAVTMNRPTAHRVGTVGRPVLGVRVHIDTSRVSDGSGEGEVVVYGPNVMRGYHGRPEATAAALTADGGMRTGDRGHLDADGYLHLTGRFKDEYKLDNGKYVFPSAVEEEIALLPWVSCALVTGAGKRNNVAVVALDPVGAARKLADLGSPMALGALCHGEEAAAVAARTALGAEIDALLGRRFARYEIPVRYAFTPEPFSLEAGTLTPTLKIRRDAVCRLFEREIAAMHEAAQQGTR